MLYFQSDGTAGKGSRDELGLTLNDFQRKSHSGGGYRGSGDQVASGDEIQPPGYDHSNDIDNR